MSDRQSHQVFICCPSHKGALLSAVVDLLASRFDEKGITYWVRHRDLDSTSEKSQRTMIQNAIRASEVFVAVLDGRTKGKTAAETRWQIEDAIANDLSIIPFNLRKPAGVKGRSGGENGDWFDDLEIVLEDRSDILVRKVQSLIGGKEEVEAEASEEEKGEEEKGEEETVEIGAGENRESEEDEDQEREVKEYEESKEEENISAEKEEEPKTVEAEAEAEAVEEDDGDDRKQRITFPLPPPKVNVRKVRRTRDSEVESEEAEEAKEKGEKNIDYPSKRKAVAAEAKTFIEAGEEADPEEADPEEAAKTEAVGKSRGGRRMATLLACAIALLVFLIGVQAVSSRRSQTNRQRNLLELELLGFSLNMYASENDGRFPDSLDELRSEGSDGATLRWRDYESHEEEEFIYWPGFGWNYNPVAVIAAAPRPDRDGKRAVLYLNAEVRRMPEELYQRRLKAGSIGPPKPLAKPAEESKGGTDGETGV